MRVSTTRGLAAHSLRLFTAMVFATFCWFFPSTVFGLVGCPDIDAKVEEFFVPATVAPGEKFPFRAKIRNTGAEDWLVADGYQLGIRFDGAGSVNDWLPPRRFNISEEVKAGKATEVEAEFRAPLTDGDYYLQMRMRRSSTPCDHFFGGYTAKATIKVSGTAEYDTLDDAEITLYAPSVLRPLQDFEIRVTATNRGPGSWVDEEFIGALNDDLTAGGSSEDPFPFPADQAHQLGLKTGIGAAPWGCPTSNCQISLPTGAAPVAEDESVEFVATFTAPQTPGSHSFSLQMNQIGDASFGNVETVNITVQSSLQAATNDSAFVRQDVPSKVITDQGVFYDVQVIMRNTGSSVWTPQEHFLENVGAVPASWIGGPITVPHAVNPGEEVTFDFLLTIPSSQSVTSYVWDWRMNRPAGPGNGCLTQTLYGPCVEFGEATSAGGALTIEVHDMTEMIIVSGDDFYIQGELDPFVPVGFNYLPYYDETGPAIPNGTLGPQQKAWFYYPEETVEQEMREMARHGVNAIRVWLPGEIYESAAGVYEPLYCDRVDHLLDNARHNAIRVMLSFPAPKFYNNFLKNVFCEYPSGSPHISCTMSQDGFYDIIKKPMAYLDPEIRDFMIDRAENMMSQCLFSDPAESRTEILSFSFWQEPDTGNEALRKSPALVEAWNDYIITVYGGPVPAKTAWSYDPGSDCYDGLLCPPDDGELCSEPTGSSDWTLMAQSYRRFVDETARDSLQDAVDSIRPLDNESSRLVGSSFGGQFTRDQARNQTLCENSGYWLDPREAHDVVDFTGVHIYPWSDQADAFDPNSTDNDLVNRYNRLRLWMDYSRGTQPVVLEETGYTTCRRDASGLFDAMRDNCLSGADLATRDATQIDTWTREADSVAGLQGNGGLYWLYRGRFDKGQAGAIQTDGTPKPIFDQLDSILSTQLGARNDIPTDWQGCIDVDRFDKVYLVEGIMDLLDQYKTVGGNGAGPVEIRTETDLPCPSSSP